MRSALVLGDLLARVADAGRVFARERTVPEDDLADRCEVLLSGSGEATGLAIAREILDRYAALSADDRLAFLRDLSRRFGVNRPALEAALARWRETDDEADLRRIHVASEPRSQELVRRLNRAPSGTRALVAMRADLLKAVAEEPALAALDDDFRHLFSSWFNRGFLELRSIDWSTPAEILEKIITYETVHEIADWKDLRRRVAAPDRRLYAFFHPALPNDPLIFVEVALTDAIPSAIGPILAEERTPLDPSAATTAVFYSINNCQYGLRGISFGNFLIKQVVEELSREFRTLKTFVTLSPAPGLRAFALREAERGEEGLLSEAEIATVRSLEAGEEPGEAAVLALAARYLLEGRSPRGGPADPVARFHLGNGARLERVNVSADGSPRGLRAAWGVMVNYLYDLPSIERNHEAFAASGAVAVSQAVRRHLRTRDTGTPVR